MAGWKRIIRGMVGTGLVFGAGSTAVTLCVGVAAMIFGNAQLDDLRFAGRVGVVGFILGVAFSGILAVAARNRRFTQLSIPKFAAIGASAGLAYFLLIATNAWNVWTPSTAIWNFLLLTGMGSGAATATLLVARRARGNVDDNDGIAINNDLDAPDAPLALGEGNAPTHSTAASSYSRESVSRNR